MERDAAIQNWLKDAQLSAVRTVLSTYRVSDFVGWLRDGSLNLKPHYQRGLVWKPQDRSFLIDSVVRQYPLPLIVFQDEISPDGRLVRRVVDGQQRLRTLLAFISPENLDKPTDADRFTYTPPELRKRRVSFTFQELSPELQQRILRTELATISLDAAANDNVVLELYDRLNSTGSPLSNQELRFARRSGPFSEISYRLARKNQARWTGWKLFNDNAIARMQEVEFTGELILLIKDGVDKTGKSELDDAYSTYDPDLEEQGLIESLFQEVMDSLDEILRYPSRPDDFRMYRGKGWFYAAFATALRLGGRLDGQWKPTDKDTPAIVPATELRTRLQRAHGQYLEAQQRQPDLVRAVSGASSDKNSRVLRSTFIYDGSADAL